MTRQRLLKATGTSPLCIVTLKGRRYRRICLSATGQKAGPLLLGQSLAVSPLNTWTPRRAILSGRSALLQSLIGNVAAEQVLALNNDDLHAGTVYADLVQGV